MGSGNKNQFFKNSEINVETMTQEVRVKCYFLFTCGLGAEIRLGNSY
jgi:hypothetical protein